MDKSAQISLHLFSNYVDILILRLVDWFLNIDQLYDVLMLEEF